MITGVAKRSTTTLQPSRPSGWAFPLRFCKRWGLRFLFSFEPLPNAHKLEIGAGIKHSRNISSASTAANRRSGSSGVSS